MYIYNLGYTTYEESEHVQLYHKEKFNKKEFNEIIVKATLNILKGYKKSEKVSFQDIS